MGTLISRESYITASHAVADQVSRIPDAAWGWPGLGVWNLRALVGHTSRAWSTVVTYLDRPATTETLTSPEQYFAHLRRTQAADAAAVAERGRLAGAALGDRPADAIGQLAEQAIDKLNGVDDRDLIETIAGGMRVSAYLPTRTFELVIHGIDLAHASGQPPTFPTPLLADTAALAARIAVETGEAITLLRALTGRASLPPDFSIV